MNLKFCVVLVLVVFIINCMMGPNVLAQNKIIEFEDVHENFWAKSAIDNWKDRGIIKGDGKNFNPNNNITRAEMVAILDNIFKYNLKKDNPFSDIKEGEWYYDALIKAYAHGVIKGSFDENGNLVAKPNAPLTRAEAAVIFTNAFSIKILPDHNSNFKDDYFPKWAKDSIFAMEASGYIRGKGGGLFEPNSNLTRAEMIQIIDNIIKLYIDTPQEYDKEVIGNVVISSPGVKLINMKVDGNVYLAEGIGEGDVEFRNIIVTGITFIRGGSSDGVKITNSNIAFEIQKEGFILNRDIEGLEDEEIPAGKEGDEEIPAEKEEKEEMPVDSKDDKGKGEGSPSTPSPDPEEEDSHSSDSADIVDY
jgi:hypothetical protein